MIVILLHLDYYILKQGKFIFRLCVAGFLLLQHQETVTEVTESPPRQ